MMGRYASLRLRGEPVINGYVRVGWKTDDRAEAETDPVSPTLLGYRRHDDRQFAENRLLSHLEQV